MRKLRFVIAGTGNRGLACFAKGLLGFAGKGPASFPERAELVALVDTNLTRARIAAGELRRPDMPVCGTVTEAQKKTHADWCIVTTPDWTHADVVVESLQAGLNVVVDKPLATSAWECDRIIDATKRTGKKALVAHNMRYMDWTLKAAKLVRAGEIGRVIFVEAAELLDLNHGGSYFQRWHSDFTKSAGLMTHKCCHYLDVLCWILDDQPLEVNARGGRSFYRERPDLNHGKRCLDCPISDKCVHYFDMDRWDGVYRRIYKEAEDEDGYIVDQCVFSDRHTINDYESVNIRFQGGAMACFSLVTFAPREHCYYRLTGTQGRIEMGTGSTDGKAYLRIIRPDKTVEQIDVAGDRGLHGHDQADQLLIADILGLGRCDPLQKAEPWEAKRAVLIADLAARSVAAAGRPVWADEAGRDFPPAPPREIF